MKVLIIDNYDSFTYNLAQLVGQCNGDTYKIVKTDMLNLNEIDDYQKILISPGFGLPGDFPNLFHILQMYLKSRSILGVCLGHQAIAEFFGAKLVNLNKVFHGVSKKVRILEDDYLFRNIPDGFEGGLYHSWAVADEGFPSELTITSRADDGTIMSFAHKNYDVKGIQFHPESIMTEFGKEIISNWISHY
jgi:anthranilate synthase/aminodeoxychorismate synthase-like glutamine amidotransferase